MAQKINVYQMVTDRIIEKMKGGIIPWKKPWHLTGSGEEFAISYTSRKPYSLLNQFILGEPGEYLTWKQIEEAGGKVKKGAKSRFVVFYSMVEAKTTEIVKPEDSKEEQVKEKKIRYPLLRYYNVWHINQTEGIESKIKPDEKLPCPDPINAADNAIAMYLMRETSLKFQNNKPSDRAFYSPSEDKVVVPMLEQYKVASEYYSTTFHEFIHSTMKESRCNRKPDGGFSFFGSHEYSKEELVAEIGAAMLCSNFDIDEVKTFNNSVAYLQAWIKVLQNDPKMIVWAAGRAEKAARYFLGEKIVTPVETA